MEAHQVRSADYLAVLLCPATRKVVVRAMVRALARLPEHDALAFVGNSGTLIGPELATKSGKKMLLVNKGGVRRHVSLLVEGAASVSRYVFVDDLVCSGDTLRYVRGKLRQYRPGAVQVGTALYTGGTGSHNLTVVDYSKGLERIPTGPVEYAFSGLKYSNLRSKVFSW